MSSKFEIRITTHFVRRLKKIKSSDTELAQKIGETLKDLSRDPFKRKLYTHKVKTRKFGKVYSSRVTGDIRILWAFYQKEPIIITLTIGGYSGGNSVY